MSFPHNIYLKYRKYKGLYLTLRGGSRQATVVPTVNEEISDMLRNSQDYPGLIDFSNNLNLDNIRGRLSRVDNFRERQTGFSDIEPKEQPFIMMPPINIPSIPTKVPVSWILPPPNNQPCDFYRVCGGDSDGTNRITLLGSGSYGSAFGVEYPPTSQTQSSPLPYQFILKLVPYEPYNMETDPDIYHYTEYPVTHQHRPENIEVFVADMLRHLFVRRDDCITPHIMLPIMAMRCPYQDTETLPITPGINSIYKLLKLLPKEKQQEIREMYQPKYSDQALESWVKKYRGPLKPISRLTGSYVEHAKSQLASLNPEEGMLVYVSEFAGYGTLIDWMWPPKPELDWKIMCFQLLYTMSVIQDTIPDWRHNDMSPRNILVQKLTISPDDRGNGYLYQWGDNWYFIPVTDFSIRLWDFDFANCDILPNYKVATPSKGGLGNPTIHWPDHGIIPDKCLQYDLHFLFNYLKVFYGSHFRNIPGSVQQLINEWLPDQLSGLDQSTYTTSDGRLSQSVQTQRGALSKITTQVYVSTDQITTPKNIPYLNQTARRQLEQHPIFHEFLVNDDQLAELRDRSSRGDRTVIINTFRYELPTPT
jgi:hypothetical protein